MIPSRMRRSTRSSGVRRLSSNARSCARSRSSAAISAWIAAGEKSSRQVVVIVDAVAGGDRRMPAREVVEVPIDELRERRCLRRGWYYRARKCDGERRHKEHRDHSFHVVKEEGTVVKLADKCRRRAPYDASPGRPPLLSVWCRASRRLRSIRSASSSVTGTSDCSGSVRRCRSSERGCSRWPRAGSRSSCPTRRLSSGWLPPRRRFRSSSCRCTPASSSTATTSCGSYARRKRCCRSRRASSGISPGRIISRSRGCSSSRSRTEPSSRSRSRRANR